jgi:Glycosyltransferase family 43.
VGFFDSWPSKRKFPVDMAGFAVSVEFLLNHPDATMPYKAGYEEDQFLRSLGLTLEDIEPKANSCTQVKYQLVNNASYLVNLAYCVWGCLKFLHSELIVCRRFLTSLFKEFGLVVVVV